MAAEGGVATATAKVALDSATGKVAVANGAVTLLLAVNAVASGVLRIVLALLVAVGVMLAAALWEAEQTAQQAP